MERKASLKTTTGIFIFFLLVNAFNKVDKLYIPFKTGIAKQEVAETWIYGTELIAFILFGAALIKAVNNISHRNFFIKQNINCFKIMALSLMLPPIVQTLGDMFDATHNWRGLVDIPLWIAAAIFMSILCNIFLYGLKLKEEQDLTI